MYRGAFAVARMARGKHAWEADLRPSRFQAARDRGVSAESNGLTPDAESRYYSAVRREVR
jgi:hypothetical protein